MRKEERDLERAIQSRIDLGYHPDDARKLAVRFLKRRKRAWAKKKNTPYTT